MKEKNFFESIYKNADKDKLSDIPWATLSPNKHLLKYLNEKDDMTYGEALVIGCGLGDDAEALSQMGYTVDAIDISPTAIAMAKERFSGNDIDFRVEDIFKLPSFMLGKYDFVFESRTIQSLDPKYKNELTKSISTLLARNGELLLHTNIQNDNENLGGPPWPLYRNDLLMFEEYDLTIQYQNEEKINRPMVMYDTVVLYKKVLNKGKQ